MKTHAATAEITPGREQYRDELNFAEFPLASLATKLPKGLKTLEFTDEIFDKSRNGTIQRKLTISASDRFGLPTATDDEVILGLIQLTAQSDFADRRVHFTRYELLKLLNWPDTTKNYKRIEQSLLRWLGVTLYYDKSWWSKEEQSWVSEGFHLLDHVQILDSERRRSKRGGEHGGKSSFVWNEVVFSSFKAGYLKQVDYEFYKRLESTVAKRMFRFLDKRFYRRTKLDFDLRTFACEHIGLSKSYHTGELKRGLIAAIQELENEGFLKKLPTEERFVRTGIGEWTIVFIRGGNCVSAPPIDVQPEATDLEKALIARGIAPASARALVSSFSEERIREKITFFDWLSEKSDVRVQRSAAGFLNKAISEDYKLPHDYQAARRKKTSVQVRKPTQAIRSEEPPSPQLLAEREAIQSYWSSLSDEERERVETELVAKAQPFIREQYHHGREERGLLFQTIRQGLIDTYVRGVLKARAA